MSSKSKPKVEKSPEEGLGEDEDVRMEKARVKEALTCQSCEEVGKDLNSFWCTRDRQWSVCVSLFVVQRGTCVCVTPETSGGREQPEEAVQRQKRRFLPQQDQESGG